MKKSIQLRAELEELNATVAAILATAEQEGRELSEEETKEVNAAIGTKEDGSDGKIHALKAQLATAEKRERFVSEQLKARFGSLPTRADDPLATAQPYSQPAVPKATGKLKHFKNEADAYAAGQFFLATVYDRPAAKQWCQDNGIFNAMRSDENDKGGFLVPTPLANTIVELREQFGVFRRNAMVWPMSSATQNIPKLAGEVTAYFTAQYEDITESDASLSQVALAVKDLYTLTPVSAQVSSDAIVMVADILARSIAQSMANKEDECGFNGDGTSTYGHIKGLANALLAGSKYTATSNATFSALTMANFEAVKGQVKRYAGMTPAWYISSTGYYASMERLLNAAGGNNNINLANGAPLNFLGDPVIFTQVMEDRTTTATGSVACYYGDLRMSAVMGDRAGIAIDADRSIYFKKNAIAIRSWERFDINVHETGTATTAGSIVAMVFG